MAESNFDREALETRAKEIRCIGTQFAMHGVSAPQALEAEYREILSKLAAGEDGPEGEEPGLDPFES